MATTRRQMSGLAPQAVFEVLRDGFSYGDWVVGTRTIRAVDPGWPAEGARLHYSVLWGPLRHDDQTTSRGYEPDRRLELQAHAWPVGTARIVIQAEPREDGAAGEHPGGPAPRGRGPAAQPGRRPADSGQERGDAAPLGSARPRDPVSPRVAARASRPVVRARSAACAAFAPGPPCTPPPGWAEDDAR